MYKERVSKETVENGFLLAKPDAVRRGCIAEAAAGLASLGIDVVGVQPVYFDTARMVELWPKMIGHYLGIEMVSFYLRSGPSQLLLLEGHEPLTAASIVKSRMRLRFGDRTLGSLFHSADTAADVERELPLLESWSSVAPGAEAPVGRPAPCWLALNDLGVSEDEVVASARILLTDLRVGRFRPVAPETDLGLPASIVVVSDDAGATPDSMLHAFMAAVPDAELGVMVAAAIQVDLIDAAPVFVGPHDRAEIVARGLREFGLDAVELRRLVVDRPFTLGGAIALSAEI